MALPAAAALAAAGLLLDIDSPRATVTLDVTGTGVPSDPVTWLALAEIGRRVPGDVRVVVVNIRGSWTSAAGGQPDDAGLAARQAGVAWLSRPDLVSVAAVAGTAGGAFFQLALACDLRILSDDAGFAADETVRGSVPSLGGTKSLVDLVGYPRALELCLTGRGVRAAEAERIGLAEMVVPPADLDRTVGRLVAAVLAAPRSSSIETKALLLGARTATRDAVLRAERDAAVRLAGERGGQVS